MASENSGWETSFLLGRPIFRGYVSFGEGSEFMPKTPDIYEVKLMAMSWMIPNDDE